MNRTGHIALSLFAFSLVYLYREVNMFYYIFVLLGAILPDFDLPIKDMHRKLFHNIWIGIVLFLLFLDHVGSLPAQLFAIGFASHIVGDALTPEGVHITWPGKTRFNVAKMKTGSREEYFLSIALFFAAFALIIQKTSYDWTKAVYVSGLLLLGLILIWLRPPK